MNKSELMGSEKLGKLLIKFSLPAVVGMLVNAIYNIVDRIFIGNVIGYMGIAGITIGFPVMLIMMGFGMLVGFGGTSLVSIKLGEGKKEEADKIISNSFMIFLFFSLIITILGLIFLTPMLSFFGASEEVMPYAQQYLQIILLGTFFQFLSFGMNNFVRGEGNPKIAMGTMLIGAVLNIILDTLFIVVLKMGIRGAALATIISMFVSAVWVMKYFFSIKCVLKITLKNMIPDFPVIKNIFALGFPVFSMQMVGSIIVILFNNRLMIHGGEIAVSALGIVHSISMFILMPVLGIKQGVQPIIGFNYGAKKYDRVKRSLYLAIFSAMIIGIFGLLLTRFFGNAIISIFSRNDQDLINTGVQAMNYFMLMLPLVGFQIIGSNHFQAIGKPKQAMLLSLSRQALLLIPLLIILPNFFGLMGIWMAIPIADFFSSLLTFSFLVVEMRLMKEKEKKLLKSNI